MYINFGENFLRLIHPVESKNKTRINLFSEYIIKPYMYVQYMNCTLFTL
jgi:hypothetical protein